tara:strand:- start:104 stop:325 length:222 start_codon:yes stop_codon:yes gene_type:complete
LRDKANNSEDITRFTHAYILEGIDIATLEKDGTYWKREQVDPSNSIKFWTDCINVSMEQLIDNYQMLTLFCET